MAMLSERPRLDDIQERVWQRVLREGKWLAKGT